MARHKTPQEQRSGVLPVRGIVRRTLASRISSWFFGEDIFLSYSRRDGSLYVAALANRLSRKYAIFFDQLGTPPGKMVPPVVKRKAAGARLLVVIASPASIDSVAMAEELQAFDTRNRPLVAVDIGNALRQAAWYGLIEGVAVFSESLDGFAANRPSDALVEVIENAFQYRRRAQRQRYAVFAAATVLAVLAGLIGASLVALDRIEDTLVQRTAELDKVTTTVRSRDLALTAERMLTESPEQAARTALQAFAAEPTPEAKRALAGAAFSLGYAKAMLGERGKRGSIIRYAPDGSTLFVAGEGHAITAWSMPGGGQTTQELEAAPPAQREIVTTLEIDPTGTYLVSATGVGIVRLWRIADRRLVRELTPRHSRSAVARFNQDGSKIVTTSEDGNAYVFDVASGAFEAELAHGGGVYGADFDSSGKLLVTSTDRGQAIVWDWRARTEVSPRFDMGDMVTHLRFVPNAPVVISCSSFPAKAWRVGQGEQAVFRTGARGRIESCELSSDGKHLALAGEGPVVTVWDVATAQPLQSLVGHGSYVYRARFDVDAKRIVTTALDHSARVWDVESGRSLAELWGHRDAVHDAVFSPDGTEVATIGFDGNARVWTIHPVDALTPPAAVADLVDITVAASGMHVVKRNAAVATAVPFGLPAAPQVTLEAGADIRDRMAAVSTAEGERLAAVVGDSHVGVWDLRSGRRMALLDGPGTFAFGLRMDRSGARVVGQYQDRIRVWDLTTNTFTDRVPTPASGGPLATVSRDGRLAAIIDEMQTLHVVDLATGESEAVRRLEWTRLQASVAFNDSGDRILLTKPGWTSMRIIDLQDRTGSADIDIDLPTRFEAFGRVLSPDGKLIATAHLDRIIRLVDLGNVKAPPLELSGHTVQIDALAFSPNGACLASGSADGDVRIWHIEGRRLIARFQAVESMGVRHVGFAPDSLHAYGRGVAPAARVRSSITSAATPYCMPMPEVARLLQQRLDALR